MPARTYRKAMVYTDASKTTSALAYVNQNEPAANIASENSQYKYGFNGKENDNEVKGDGNQQDYGMRAYDNRLGRFFRVDPLAKSYPWWTPFAFSGNTPIQAVDLDGLEIFYSQSGQKIGVYGKSTEIRVVNESHLKNANINFAAYSKDLKTNQAATNEFLGGELITQGSVAFENYFKTVKDVTKGRSVVGYSTYGDCRKAASAQLAKQGVTALDGNVNSINAKVESDSKLPEDKIGAAIYTMTELNKGKPVMVGLEVSLKGGGKISAGNTNNNTSHFVVVNASTNNNGKINFEYLDNTGNKRDPANNQLSVDKASGAMKDNTYTNIPGTDKVEVSEVRKNKK